MVGEIHVDGPEDQNDQNDQNDTRTTKGTYGKYFHFFLFFCSFFYISVIIGYLVLEKYQFLNILLYKKYVVMSNDHDVLQDKFVNVNGISMHYVTTENDNNRPLMVFLHGFPEFWYSWRHQIPFFEKHFKVVAPDLRGYGETDAPTDIREYRIDKLVTDVVELIHSLGKEKAIIVGHDWGGIIGWSIAMIAPGVVEKLIVMNAPHPASYQKNAFNNLAQMQKSWYIFFFLLQKSSRKSAEW